MRLQDVFACKIGTKKIILFLIFVCLGVYFAWARFDQYFLSGGRYVIGDNGDPRFILFGLEHVYQSLRGSWSLLDPPMYFPLKGTVMRSDWSLSLGAIYSVFRFLGVDQFTSFEATMIAANFALYGLTVVCFISITGLPLLPSSLLSLVISFFGFLHGYRFWLQNFSIFILPLIFISLNFSCHALTDVISTQRKIKFTGLDKRLYGALFITGALICLMYFSNYYIGLGASASVNMVYISYFFFRTRRSSGSMVGGCLALTMHLTVLNLGFILFALIHISSYSSSISNYAGIANLSVSQTLVSGHYLDFVSLTALLFTVWIIFKVLTARRKCLNHRSLFLFSIFISICLALLVFAPLLTSSSFSEESMKIDSNRMSMVTWLYQRFSPLQSIRDFTRVFFPFYFSAFILIASLFSEFRFSIISGLKSDSTLNQAANAFLLIAVIVVSVSLYRWPIADQKLSAKYDHNLDAFSHRSSFVKAKTQLAIQGNCDAFYLVSKSSINDLSKLAILMAADSHVPTIHGYTGAHPHGSVSPGRDDIQMENSVQAWIQQHELDQSHVCKIAID